MPRPALLLSLLLLAGPAIAQDKANKKPPVVLTEAALKLHRSALLIDGHNDLPWKLREKANSSLDKMDIAQPQPTVQTDITRLREGNVGAQFWAAYCPAETIRTGTSAHYTLEQIDLIHQMVKRYPDTFAFAASTADIERIHKQGKIASLIGIEGGHAIEDSLSLLRMYHKLGVRYMTLTHTDSLSWADSATDEARSNGLSPFGQEVVLEMNRLGMLVDISHVSADTMRHVLRISKAPVIFSHSSAYAIAQHSRNVPDDVLRAMPRNGGLVMVNFYSGFVHPVAAERMRNVLEIRRDLRVKYADDETAYQQALDKWRADNPIPRGDVRLVVDHIEHIAKTAGIDHVGLGSDFDGITTWPEQLDHVGHFPYITQELLTRGHSEEDIRKILGLNFMRVFREAEAAAKKLQE